MRDKIGNYIRVFCVTCQWKAEGWFEGKLDRELKLQAVLSKTKEQLTLSCILRLWRIWQRALSLVAGRSSSHQQGSDGTRGIWAFIYLYFSPINLWAIPQARCSGFAFSISLRGYMWSATEGALSSCVSAISCLHPSAVQILLLAWVESWTGGAVGQKTFLQKGSEGVDRTIPFSLHFNHCAVP